MKIVHFVDPEIYEVCVNPAKGIYFAGQTKKGVGCPNHVQKRTQSKNRSSSIGQSERT